MSTVNATNTEHDLALVVITGRDGSETSHGLGSLSREEAVELVLEVLGRADGEWRRADIWIRECLVEAIYPEGEISGDLTAVGGTTLGSPRERRDPESGDDL